MNAHAFNDQFSVRVMSERRITNEILNDILFAEDHRFHLELGFSSLFEWLTTGHGYSESAAHRRIQGARMLRTNPEVSEKLASGKTNLTNVARAQSVIRAQERISGKISNEEKSRVIEQIEGKTTIQAEHTLMAIFPEVASLVNQERRTVIDAETTRLCMNFTNEQMAQLERVRDLLSHTLPHATFADVIAYVNNDFLDRKDPLRKPPPENTVTDKQRVTKDVSVSARRVTIQKAEGRCEYIDPETGRVCGSTFQIETDHIKPRAHGGGNEAENLRCLCRAHNQLMSEKILGKAAATEWRHKSSD